MTDSGTTSQTSAGYEWMIGPRVLPPPAGASEELRAILAREPAPQPPPAAKTSEELEGFVAKLDAKEAAMADSLAAKFNVKFEQSEIEGVPVYNLTPPRTAAEHADHLFVFVHGGGFVLGAGKAGLHEGLAVAGNLGLPVISIDYRMPPQHAAPAALDDVMKVWQHVTAERPAATTALGGTSAGGNLTLAATLKMRDTGVALPGALFVGTPAADLAKRGDSRFIMDGIDHTLVSWDPVINPAVSAYAANLGFDHAYISPILGDFTGFPPTYLISGTRDMLLSDTAGVHRRLRQAGVDADLHVYEGFSHADYSFLDGTPESHQHYRELNAFLLQHLPASGS